MTNLCTLFDARYLAKGLALLRSIARHLPDWHLYVLALDGLTFDIMAELATMPEYRGRLEVKPLRVLEAEYPELAPAKASRTRREYIFTLTPAWLAYLLTDNDLYDLAYVDSDMWLLSDLAPLYSEAAIGSIGIIPHRWTPRHADRLRPNGIYNVGWVYFRSDDAGADCLSDWLRECLAYSGPHGKFSDQVYLDTWPDRWGKLCRVIEHRGAGLAPWNQERYHYARMADGRLCLYDPDEVKPVAWPILLYHFHELSQGPDGHIYRTGYPLAPDVVKYIYEPYEQELMRSAR